MSAIPQQFVVSQKASLEKVLAVQSTVFTGFEKLVDLQLKAIKATLEDVAQKSQEAIEVKDPQEALALGSAWAQPGAERALAYSKHVYDIVSGVQSDLSRLAEEQLSQGREQFTQAIDQFAKNAPTGSESAVALLKSSLASATNAIESINRATKQAVQTAETNINAATDATLRAAASAADAAQPAARATRRSAS